MFEITKSMLHDSDCMAKSGLPNEVYGPFSVVCGNFYFQNCFWVAENTININDHKIYVE